MTGLVRKAAILAACGVVFGAAVAFAGVPSPGNSTIPGRINLVGIEAGLMVADAGAFGATVTVTVRDLGNNPIANSSVVLDFSGATSDVRIGDGANQLYPGVVANCATYGVSSLTNVAGVATLVVVGGGQSPVGAAHAVGAGKVYADGVLLGNFSMGLYDLNGADGVTLADLGLWSGDYFGATNPDRADYDGLGGVDLVDLATWSGTYFAGQSNISATTYCP